MKYLFVGTLLFLSSSYLYSADRIQLFESKEKMHDQLTAYIPIGSGIMKGVELLEQNKFSCHWSDKKLYTGNRVSHYVDCFHAANPLKPTEKYWQIIIFYSNDLVELIEVKYETTIKKGGTLYTVISNAETRYTVRDKGKITFYNHKKFTLSEFLFSLKNYLEEYENIMLFFKAEDIPYAKVDDYNNVTLTELLTNIERKNRIKVVRNRGGFKIIKEW